MPSKCAPPTASISAIRKNSTLRRRRTRLPRHGSSWISGCGTDCASVLACDHGGVRTPVRGSALEPIPRLENPPYRRETGAEKQGGHRKAHGDVHVGHLEEAPPEAADEIDNGVRQRDGLPSRWQYADG